MRDRNPTRTARRNIARQDRIGINTFCLFCGYGCLESLTRVSCEWLEAHGIPGSLINRLLEKHHVCGYAHDQNLTVTLCLNCHREITEKLARAGVSMRPEKNLRRLIVFVFRSSAVLFESLALSYRNWATRVEGEDEF